MQKEVKDKRDKVIHIYFDLWKKREESQILTYPNTNYNVNIDLDPANRSVHAEFCSHEQSKAHG